MNRTSINHSALVFSVAMATAWPLSPAVADKGGTPHKDGVHPMFGLAAPSDGPFSIGPLHRSRSGAEHLRAHQSADAGLHDRAFGVHGSQAAQRAGRLQHP